MQQDKRPTLSEPLRSETLVCGPMMRELRRWTTPTRSQVMRRRWAEWAGSIIDRHRAITARYGRQAMTLVRPATVVQLHERLINRSPRVYSQMSLTIQPLLREVRVIREKAARASEAQPGAARTISGPDANAVLVRPVVSTADGAAGALRPLTVVERRPATERSSQSSQIRDGEERASASSAKALSAGDHSINGVEKLPRGLSLVFRRLPQPNEFIQTHRRTHTIYESAGQLTTSLVKRSQRIEQPVTGSAAIVRQSPPNHQQVAPQVVTTEHTPATFKSQPPWAAVAPQMPDLMVEQLTEHVIRQIDQRAIAWRERLGKI